MAEPWARRLARLDEDGWQLDSAEERNREHPETFWIPPRRDRDRIEVGQAAQLLFLIQTIDDDGITELVTERMWTLVTGRVGHFYIGTLENQPGLIEPGHLDRGSALVFQAEHVMDITDPPTEYIDDRLGHHPALKP